MAHICNTTNDLLLDRQATPLHTPCPGLNFVYFPIPVAQVVPLSKDGIDQPVNLVHGLRKKQIILLLNFGKQLEPPV